MREFFNGWRPKAGCALMVIVVVAALLPVVCVWMTQGVLPSQRTMLQMDTNELRQLIVGVTPIGVERSDVEKALRYKFCKTWEVVTYESTAYMSRLGFSVPVAEGDYYFRSDFAVVGMMLAEVVTVRFLFDQNGELKDVQIYKWGDAL